ncbi:MAG: hypothetical protein AAGJ38_00230 [Planctomycetota bacterium]
MTTLLCDSFRYVAVVCLATHVALFSSSDSAAQSQPELDQKYYIVEDIPTPEGVVFEASAICRISLDRVALATRRGEIYFADNLFGPVDEIRFTRFATGLGEVMGLVFHDGWLYASENAQLLRIRDEDGDDRADIYETFNSDWGSSPENLFEWCWLLPQDSEGNFWALLTLSNSHASQNYLRGWAIRISPDGDLIPTAAGVRSPGGGGYDSRGKLFYCDNQGHWNGTNGIKHLTIGSHQGNPSGNRWFKEANADLEKLGMAGLVGDDPGMPPDQSYIEDERRRNPRFIPPAVQVPIGRMGRSPTQIVWDKSQGKFGPFSKQLFVGEHTHSEVLRVFLETVNGVEQGVVFPFLQGLRSGPVGLLMAEEGYLFTAETDRGWGARGGSRYAFERIRWTGATPFEVLEMRITDEGFELTFTEQVDLATAGDPTSYTMSSWTYWLQGSYGSPEIDFTQQTIVAATVEPDGLTVRLQVEGRVQGHVHEIKLDGVRSAKTKKPLWHPIAYYTINEIPGS